MTGSRLLSAGLTLTAALMLLGCAGGPGSSATPGASVPTSSATPGTGATSVDVTLQEFSILPEVASVPAGDVTFVVTNTGPDDVHEFVILKTDLAADALPTNADGSVDEEAAGIEVIDEVEDLAVGDAEELTVSLDAGAYVLICNIFDADENEAHYQMGMRTAFTVE